jgi:hypothetical protein
MKTLLGIAAAAALAAPGVAWAQSGSGQSTLFECTLRNGKTVRVTEQGGNFFYDYGTRNRRELSLRGSARSGNVFFLHQRFYATFTQIRFTNGQHSYIVHELPAHQSGDPAGHSGLMVLRGRRVISNQTCRRLTEFRGWSQLEALPEDPESWSAMSLEE